MSSSNPTPTHDSPLQPDPPHESKSPNDPPLADPPQQASVQESNEAEEEEEAECGFCLFMKAGGCRDPFIEWEKCVEEGEKNKEDIVDKCHGVTKALKDCMEAHPDHYGPILQAEKAAEQELEKEMEKEGNVQSNSKQQEEIKQSGLVAESVETVQVEEMPNATDSEHKLGF